MNILFLLGKFPSVGGVETVTAILANEFSARGHAVHVVSFEQVMKRPPLRWTTGSPCTG